MGKWLNKEDADDITEQLVLSSLNQTQSAIYIYLFMYIYIYLLVTIFFFMLPTLCS